MHMENTNYFFYIKDKIQHTILVNFRQMPKEGKY